MKSTYFKKPLIVALAIVVVLFLAGLATTPLLLDMGLERWIDSRGPGRGKVENIDFNPFSGRLSMDNLVVETKSGRTLIIPHAYLTFSWKQLFRKHLYLKKLVLQDTFVLVDRLEGKGFRVGGLILRELVGAENKGNEPGWEVGIGHFELQNARVAYDTPELTATYHIDKYTLKGLETWNKEKPVQMQLAGRIDESPVQIKAEIKPLAAVKSWQGSIVLEKGSLDLLAKARGLQEFAPSGTLDLDLKVDARMQEDGAITVNTSGKFILENMQLQHEGYALQQEKITWQGSISGDTAADGKPAVDIDGQLTGQNLALDNGARSMQLKLEGFSWKGQAGGRNLTEANIGFTGHGTAALENLQLQHEGYALQQEKITWQGSISGDTAADGKPAVDVDGKLAGTGLSVDDSGQSLQLLLGTLNWEGKAGVNSGENSRGVTMESRLEGDDVRINDLQDSLELLGLNKFTISGIRIGEQENILAARVDLQKVRLAKKKNPAEGTREARPSLLQTSAATITSINLKPGVELSLDTVTLNDLEADIRRTRNNEWQIMPSLLEKVETHPAQSGLKAENTAAAGKPFRLQLKKIQTNGVSFVKFADESLERPLRTTFHIKELQVADIDSGDPANSAHFKVEGQVGNYGSITFDGSVKPADKPLTLDMKGTLNALDMVPFTSYAKRTTGYNVTSGQMDADILLNIERGKMDGNFSLLMRNLEVVLAEQGKEAAIDQQLDVPLDTALSMLRNKDNEIKLDLTLQGDMENPTFGVQDAINQALAKAMKFAAFSYLKYALQPFGTYIAIAEVVAKVGGEIAKVRLDPVIFPPGESGLNREASRYLEKVAEVLNNRPNLRVEICGKAVAEDRAALLGLKKSAQPEKKGKKAGVEPPTDEELRKLAKNRADLVKEVLVKQYEISHERLYLCLPEILDSPEQKPMVELLID